MSTRRNLSVEAILCRLYRVLALAAIIVVIGLVAPVQAGAVATSCPVTNTFTAGTTAVASQVNANFANLVACIQELQAKINALLANLNADSNGNLTLTGVNFTVSGGNLYVQSGAGTTTAAINSKGNLIIGYDENDGSDTKTGSHNLIIGPNHSYSSYGGVVAGSNNNISAPSASVTGGANNTASGLAASVTGGEFNTASAQTASVSGGSVNQATGILASISGGDTNTASGQNSSISGGFFGKASGYTSSVRGGEENEASGTLASVSGGVGNIAGGSYSSISGGGNFGGGSGCTTATMFFFWGVGKVGVTGCSTTTNP